MDKRTTLYKVFTEAEWEGFNRSGQFEGSKLDKSDGFIHMSAATEVQGTLDKHFKQGLPLILAAFDSVELGTLLKWEISRGDVEFPHYYGVLKKSDVKAHFGLSADSEARYDATKYLQG